MTPWDDILSALSQLVLLCFSYSLPFLFENGHPVKAITWRSGLIMWLENLPFSFHHPSVVLAILRSGSHPVDKVRFIWKKQQTTNS